MKTLNTLLQSAALVAVGAALGTGASSQRSRTDATPSVATPRVVHSEGTPPRLQSAPRRATRKHEASQHSALRVMPKSAITPAMSPPFAPFTLPISFAPYEMTERTASRPTAMPTPRAKAAALLPAQTTTITSDKSRVAVMPLVLSDTMQPESVSLLVSAPDDTPRDLPQVLPPVVEVPAEPSTDEPLPATVTTNVPVAALLLRDAILPAELDGVLASRPVVNEVLTPERAVEIALRESPVIRGAVAEVEAEEGRLKAARAERKPMVSANTFLSGGSIPNIIESPQTIQPSMIMNLPHGGYFDQNLMVMFPLFTSGRLKAAVRQAAALRNASQAELETQRQETALLTRLAFREVQARRALVEVQVARLRENEEQLRIDRAKADEGKIPPFYVLRSEAEVAATNQELTNARRDVELSLLQLQTVMGISPASQIEIKDALSYEPSTQFLKSLAPSAPSDLAALLRLAEKQRPELQAAGSRVLAASAETSSIRSSYRPQISAFGMGDMMKMQGEPTSGGTTFGVMASVSIWSGGRKSAELKTAQAERQKQEAEKAKAALQIGQEVTAAVLNLRTGEQNIGTAQTALKSAQEDYRVARIRYEAGKSTLVEVLDALASRVRAESNIVQALYQYNTARDQLLRAIGSGTL